MSEHLTHHHRETLTHLFDHQQSANIHWREVRHLLEAVGTVSDEHNGKVKIHVGEKSIVIHDPGRHEIDRQLVVDLRHLLTDAGLAPEA
jgi:hypothetical protein